MTLEERGRVLCEGWDFGIIGGRLPDAISSTQFLVERLSSAIQNGG